MNEHKHLKHEQHICRFMHDNNNSTEQMLLPKKLHFPVERCGADRCVGFVEGIHRKLSETQTGFKTNAMHSYDTGISLQMLPSCRDHKHH